MDNKTHNNLKFAVVGDVQVPEFKESNARGGYVRWGDDNRLPQYLYDLYTRTSQMTSIVGSMVDYIMGDEVITTGRLSERCNRKGESLEDVVRKCTFDLCIFGGMSVEIIRNKLGDIAEVNWVDFRNVRVNEDEDEIWLSKDWTGRGKTIRYQRFRSDSRQPVSIFYYKGHNTRTHYPVPMYIGALKSLVISSEVANYHLVNILSGFNATTIINFNNGSDLPEEVMDRIEQNVYDKFAGTNGKRIILSFNDTKDHATTFEKLPEDSTDNKYTNLMESVTGDIYQAFRINPILVGVNNTNSGFSKQEFEQAFALYNKTVIMPMQKELIRCFDTILGEGTLSVRPFTVNWGEDNNTSSNDTAL